MKKALSLVLVGIMCVMSTSAFATSNPQVEEVPVDTVTSNSKSAHEIDIWEEIAAIEKAIMEKGDVVEFLLSEGVDIEKFIEEGGGTTIADEIKETSDSTEQEVELVLLIDIWQEIKAIEKAIEEKGDVIEFLMSEGVDIEKFIKEGGGTTIADEIKE